MPRKPTSAKPTIAKPTSPRKAAAAKPTTTKPAAAKPAAAKQTTTFDTARQIALALPKVEEYTCYGTPAFRAGGKLLARLKEDGDSLVLKIGFDAKEILLEADPEVFYTTDHYNGYPMVLVRLSKVSADSLKQLLLDAYRFSAPKRLAAALDGPAAEPAPARASTPDGAASSRKPRPAAGASKPLRARPRQG